MAAEIRLFPCLTDNFGALIHDPATNATAAIDAPEAAPVIAALDSDRPDSLETGFAIRRTCPRKPNQNACVATFAR